MTTEDSAGKPHKVWSCDRQTRKCVVASCLDELRTKGAAKLGYSNPFDLKIVLEIDGTEVEDENYFQRAERDTVFLMLQPSEKWLPPGVEALRAGHDETDGDVGTLPVLNRKCLDPLSLLRHLEKDASSVVHFTEEQLELVSEVPKESLDPRMFNLSFVETVRDTCGRLLVERREAQEAIDLIKILARSSQEAFSDAKPGNTRADSEQTGETSGEEDKDRISGRPTKKPKTG
ncbi:conserved hypothetical protein [Ixodes scapularis]|uniref:CIDE-N domain-containing protein n=1 Tax=Ixodes scapularis TaxID=6945 RepID=B7PJN6_IXOSC|nr:conserved hypothetical protein [Ixodes scapularis]|eukprot:XP_002408366.1 conserved hypothetical protein [Ixodes scapularis]